MTRLAAADSSDRISFAVDDLEIRRLGMTFTFDTVRELNARGVSNVHWLIGADQHLYPFGDAA